MSVLDVLIVGGEIIDGTGAPGFIGDIGIKDGRIVEVGADGPRHATTLIDARGMIVCPGFVDMHAHSDLRLLEHPRSLPKTMQGVTTEVIGQDGLSYAPVSDESLDQLRIQLAGWNGSGASLDWSWRTVEQFLARFDRKTAVNVAYLLPHGTIRMNVMGSTGAIADASQIDQMQSMVRVGLAEGAIGLSTGLTYAPAQYSDLAELTALCIPVAEAGGIFSPHIRSYGSGVLEGYEEVLTAATNSGVALHLTHCQMSFPGNEGRASQLRHLIDTQFDNVDVTYDSYCYVAGSTFLAAFLPGWAWEEGPAGLLRLLKDDEAAERIRYELEDIGTVGFHGTPIDWSRIQIGSVATDTDESIVGMRITELADIWGMSSFAAARALLIREELSVNVLTFVGHEDNIREIMTWPGHMAGSDGIMVGDRPHPRAWGTFARYLGHYARDEGMFTWPEIIRKMTSMPARRLGQRDRGELRPGMWADVVVFDPQTVAAEATYDEPMQFPTGIDHVLVNGQLVKHHGEPTDAMPGRVLTLQGTQA